MSEEEKIVKYLKEYKDILNKKSLKEENIYLFEKYINEISDIIDIIVNLEYKENRKRSKILDIEEKIKDIKERASKSNKYILYADKTDIDFLLSIIEMQQKQLDDIRGITEDDLPF